jgi:hypothetical protein
LTKERANRSEANLVDERAELGDGVLPVADNLEGGLLLPGELAHARLLQLQLLAQLQLNLPLRDDSVRFSNPNPRVIFVCLFLLFRIRIRIGNADPEISCFEVLDVLISKFM